MAINLEKLSSQQKSILSCLPDCEVVSIISQEEDEKKWLAVRSCGIGGSDIGPICGVSPFTSARQIYLKKTNQYPADFEPNETAKERMHFGHVLEPLVATEYTNRTGKKIVNLPITLCSKKYPWMLANIDRLIVDDEGHPYGVLECKTSSEYMNDEWSEGNLMITYLYQLNWYLSVLGLNYGAFACLVGGNKFYTYELFRNDELINNTLIPAGNAFWNNNIANMIEPEMQAADTEFANTMFKKADKNSEVSFDDDTTDQLLYTIVNNKAQIKALTATMEEAQNRVKDRLREHEIGYTPNFTVKWSPRSQKRVDSTLLKTNFPDVYNKVLKTTEFRTMTVKGNV